MVINPDGDEIAIRYNEEGYKNYYFYYEIWENFHFFGLPHGQGWIHEKPWIIDFLKYFQNIYNQFEIFKIKKGGAN